MAALESTTAPLVGAMLDGTRPLLKSEEQETLSLWMFKTALVVTLLNDYEATKVDAAHYERLRSGNMPPNTYVWLGCMGGAEIEAGSWLQRVEWQDRHTGQTGDGYAFVVCALELVSFGVVMGGEGEVPPLWKMGPRSAESLRRMWPVSQSYSVDWASGRPVTYADVQELMDQLRRGGDAAPLSLVPG